MSDDSLIARWLGAVELLAGITAVLGGAALAMIPGEAGAGAPFELFHGTYIVPGAVLCVVVGSANTVAGILAIRRHRAARVLSVLAGGTLIAWTFAAIVLTAYRPPIPVAYVLVAVAIFAGASAWIASGPKRTAHRRVAMWADQISRGATAPPGKSRPARAAFRAKQY